MIQKACPLFVPLVEEGLLDHPITHLTVQHYLKDLQGRVDALLLGCTHYPLLRRAIQRFMGEEVLLVESGPALAFSLRKNGFRLTGGGMRRFFVTDDAGRFSELSRLFLGERVGEVEVLPLPELEALG